MKTDYFLKILKEALSTDIVSFSEFAVLCDLPDGFMFNDVHDILELALRNGVEVGGAVNMGDYVKFVAWEGSLPKKLLLLRERFESCSWEQVQFTVWFCVTNNVDEWVSVEEAGSIKVKGDNLR